MINGRIDFHYPMETPQLPLFQLLGVAPEHKRHAALEGGHIPDEPERSDCARRSTGSIATSVRCGSRPRPFRTCSSASRHASATFLGAAYGSGVLAAQWLSGSGQAPGARPREFCARVRQ